MAITFPPGPGQGDTRIQGGITYRYNGSSWEALGNNTADGSYTPSTDAHWTDPNPTTVGDALDRLAAVVYALNGNSGS
jgi:hypothetical protein